MSIIRSQMKNHRKDISGLRALAVLLVVFYHLNSSYFPSGFIGVDVFFVISGFLITQHLVRDIQGGQFSFRGFYLRRIRRILPALLTVILLTSIAAYFLLIPSRLLSYAQTLLPAILGYSNLHLASVVQYGYFATDVKLIPLLHTWSLGLEEQFYILWPIVLFTMIHRFQKKVLPLTLLYCLGSFLLYMAMREHGKIDFFMPMTRGFELLIGCNLAIMWPNIKHCNNQWGNNILSLAGLMSIIYAACFLPPSAYPGMYSLLPTLGAALLIYTGEKQSIVNKLLTLKSIVFIGLISYSLYLWHWPIISLISSLNIHIGIYMGASILFLSILLSTLSWRFIEQPFRYKYHYPFLKTFCLFIVTPAIIATIALLILKWKPDIGFNTVSANAYKVTQNFIGPLPDVCADTNKAEPASETKCSIGDANAKHTAAIVVGDSHAYSIGWMLGELFKNAQIKGYLVSQSGTPYILGNIPEWRSNNPMKRNAWIENQILTHHYKYVVMASYWNYYPNEAITKNSAQKRSFSTLAIGLKNAVKSIIKAGSLPVIVLDVPPLLNISKYCGFTRLSRVNICENSLHTIKADQKETRKIIFNLKKEYPQIILINPGKVICKDEKCRSSIGQTPLYFSGDKNSHLNYEGSKLVGKIYLQKYKNPFVQN